MFESIIGPFLPWPHLDPLPSLIEYPPPQKRVRVWAEAFYPSDTGASFWRIRPWPEVVTLGAERRLRARILFLRANPHLVGRVLDFGQTPGDLGPTPKGIEIVEFPPGEPAEGWFFAPEECEPAPRESFIGGIDLSAEEMIFKKSGNVVVRLGDHGIRVFADPSFPPEMLPVLFDPNGFGWDK